MREDLKRFDTLPREEQKGILIRCFRNFGKTVTGMEYAKDILLNYPLIVDELMTEINVEWQAALDKRNEKEASS